MIDRKVVDELNKLGEQVKKIAPDYDGKIIFNLSRNHETPKVNIMAADVTRAKK